MSDNEISGCGALAVAAYLGVGLIPALIAFGPLILAHPMITGQLIIAAYQFSRKRKALKR